MLKKMVVCMLISAAALAFANVAPVQVVAEKAPTNFVKDGVWSIQDTNFSNESRGIKDLHAVNESIVWGTAYDGSAASAKIQELCKTTDGGDSWSEVVMTGLSNVSPAMVHAIDADKAYVAMYVDGSGSPQGVYYTVDGGVTWTHQETAAFSDANSFINVVHFFNENDGFCQGDPANGYFELYTTADGGANWVRVPEANIPANVSGEYGTVGYYDSIGDDIWFGTNKGRVYRSADKGMTWDVSEAAMAGKPVDCVFSDNMNGLAMDKSSGTTGAISKTTDGGVTWEAVTTTGLVYTNDFVAVPGVTNVYVTTGADATNEKAGSTYTYDGGDTWNEFTEMIGTQMLSTDFASNERGWAGGFNTAGLGGMFRYDGAILGIEDNELAIPSVVTMENNYPNPFNPSTTINFALKAAAQVNLSVFDASGAKVSELVNSSMVKGDHKVDFNAANLAAGVYYYTINANGFSVSKKMVLAK